MRPLILAGDNLATLFCREMEGLKGEQNIVPYLDKQALVNERVSDLERRLMNYLASQITEKDQTLFDDVYIPSSYLLKRGQGELLLGRDPLSNYRELSRKWGGSFRPLLEDEAKNFNKEWMEFYALLLEMTLGPVVKNPKAKKITLKEFLKKFTPPLFKNLLTTFEEKKEWVPFLKAFYLNKLTMRTSEEENMYLLLSLLAPSFKLDVKKINISTKEGRELNLSEGKVIYCGGDLPHSHLRVQGSPTYYVTGKMVFSQNEGPSFLSDRLVYSHAALEGSALPLFQLEKESAGVSLLFSYLKSEGMNWRFLHDPIFSILNSYLEEIFGQKNLLRADAIIETHSAILVHENCGERARTPIFYQVKLAKDILLKDKDFTYFGPFNKRPWGSWSDYVEMAKRI